MPDPALLERNSIDPAICSGKPRLWRMSDQELYERCEAR
jgi:hypothetical protein